MYDNTKNLLFLLAAAPLASGCIVTIADDVNTGDDTTGGDGDGDASTGDGDGDPTTTGDGDGDPTTTGDGDGDPTTTGDGDGDPATGDGDGDPTATGDGDGDPSLCGSYGDKVAECYGDPQYGMAAYEYCQQYLGALDSYGPECVASYEDYVACLSALTCEEFTGDAPCPDELAALEANCTPPFVAQLGVRNK